jgi:hypothetical protein
MNGDGNITHPPGGNHCGDGCGGDGAWVAGTFPLLCCTNIPGLVVDHDHGVAIFVGVDITHDAAPINGVRHCTITLWTRQP